MFARGSVTRVVAIGVLVVMCALTVKLSAGARPAASANGLCVEICSGQGSLELCPQALCGDRLPSEIAVFGKFTFEAGVNGNVANAMLIRLNQRGYVALALGDAADRDVSAVMVIVMMEAAKSAQEDLRQIMQGVKAINTENEQLRGVRSRISFTPLFCQAAFCPWFESLNG